MLKYRLFIAWIFFGGLLFAQKTIDVQGAWKGELTQDTGGYAETYSFEIYIHSLLSEQGMKVHGRTYIRINEAYATMSFTGLYKNNMLILEEKEILDSDKPSLLSWCYKKMELELIKEKGNWLLKGVWEARSEYGYCLPGMVVLKRMPPQA